MQKKEFKTDNRQETGSTSRDTAKIVSGLRNMAVVACLVVGIMFVACDKDSGKQVYFKLTAESTYYPKGWAQEVIIANNSGENAIFKVTIGNGEQEIIEGQTFYIDDNSSYKITAYIIGGKYAGSTVSIIVGTKGGGARHEIYLTKE